jgi:hypothetical protein
MTFAEKLSDALTTSGMAGRIKARGITQKAFDASGLQRDVNYGHTNYIPAVGYDHVTGAIDQTAKDFDDKMSFARRSVRQPVLMAQCEICGRRHDARDCKKKVQ